MEPERDSKPKRLQLGDVGKESQHVEHPKKGIPKKSFSTKKTSDRHTAPKTSGAAPRSQRDSNQGVENRQRSAITFFADRLGVAEDALPRMTNGELMRIAGVDIQTLHGWQYLNRDLPEAAITKLHEYFATCLGRQ